MLIMSDQTPEVSDDTQLILDLDDFSHAPGVLFSDLASIVGTSGYASSLFAKPKCPICNAPNGRCMNIHQWIERARTGEI